MYQEIILDHYRNPHGRGLLDPFDAEVHHVNPTCGDEVTLRGVLKDGTIAELRWDAEGCTLTPGAQQVRGGEALRISGAATWVMSARVGGKPVDEAMTLQQKFLELMQSRGQ